MANHRIKQDADHEFRRGLEEFVRGHIDDCMTNFSSCSSAVAGDDEDESSLSATERRRRRSALDGDDLAESSAAARRHSRILSRWVARQAEEMITTMERRNRESELMALAGLHTVSMLDPSFLREARRSRSRSPSNLERPTEAGASRILQMWRELEDMSRERRSAVNSVGGDRIRTDDVSESDETGYFDEDRRSSREQSPDLGDDRERERVREIVSRISETTGSRISNSNRAESPRSEWLGETERERVRLVREWVQMASEQRDGRSSRREEERDRRSRDGSVTDHEEGQPEHVRRDLLRIRGRQARLDLIMRMVRERERELQGLEEQRSVSEFPHRNRIQVSSMNLNYIINDPESNIMCLIFV